MDRRKEQERGKGREGKDTREEEARIQEKKKELV
jgi:hypothetical protein